MEVTAQDRPGLLYQIALALKHCRVNLVAAKVGTYGERAEDIFFVNSREKTPLSDKQKLICLEDEIIKRIGAPVTNEGTMAVST
jgi:[protein-PII] uridylyltransferase